MAMTVNAVMQMQMQMQMAMALTLAQDRWSLREWSWWSA
jgi:hypothetical protein